MSTKLTWHGTKQIEANMRQFQNKVTNALKQVAQYWAGVLEGYAKDHAPWTDRTANARQSLHTLVQELSSDTVRLYLAHGMNYGVYLETRWAGRYAILWPTIEVHLAEIRRMLKGIFK